MKKYSGQRTATGNIVRVNGIRLPPRTDILNLSQNGFEWGYDGAGPSQLAVAILADYLEDPILVRQHYKCIRDQIIAHLEDGSWELVDSELKEALKSDHQDNAASSENGSGVVHVNMTLEELLNKVRGI